MSTARSYPRSGLLGGALLALVLVGLIGMHGIAGHGHAAPPSLPAASPAHHAESQAHHGAPQAVSAAVDAPTLAADLAPRAPDRWVALCLAVLVGAVLLLAVGRGSIPLGAVPLTRPVRSPAPGRRDRDPPSLVVLRVRRC